MTRFRRCQYDYRGPARGSFWDRPSTRRVLRETWEILIELHERAGYPSVAALTDYPGTPSHATIRSLLTGQRLPTWELTWAIGSALAELSGTNVADARRRLYAAYTARPKEN